MAALLLTRERAWCFGVDAGNMAMRKAGRSKWSVEDYNRACEVINRLMSYLYPEIAHLLVKDNEEKGQP